VPPSTQPVIPDGRLAHLLEASEGAKAGHDLPRRSLIFDALVMIIFVAVGLLLLRVLSPRADLEDFLFVFLVNVPLLVRRRFPRGCFFVIFATGLVQMLLRIPIGLYDAGLLFALYSAVGYTGRRFGLLALGVGGIAVVVGALTDWWLYVDRQLAAPSAWLRLVSALGAAVLVAATWAMGERLRSGRYGVIALAQRADQFEREREQQALLAAAAERSRIAREMHDVIAHGLSVMIVQADGAAYVVQESPDTARQALEQISATGRESLSQMRNLLGLLRNGTGAEESAAAPQPDLDDLDTRLDVALEAGPALTVRRSGTPRRLSAMVSLTAYRVVQEALTNVRKHGGDRVEVELSYTDDGIRIVVTDSGGGSNDRRTPIQSHGQGDGYGLLGMRERVAAVGGQLTAGPTAGGFEINAWLPDAADDSEGASG
jgi:signal transduction histidine kinase